MENANEAIKELLRALGIERIVFVDDLFTKKATIADVQTAQLSLAPDNVIATIGDLAKDLRLADDPDVRRTQFEKFWNARANDQQREHVAEKLFAAANMSKTGEPQDVAAAAALADVVGTDKMTTLAPSEWETRKAEFLAEAKEGKSLLLFDQDLSGDSQSATSGMSIIASILAGGDMSKVMCGLLSHTVTTENENAQWIQLAEQFNLDRDLFVVIAKENLTGDRLQFCRMLKMAALSPGCRDVKNEVQSILTDSAKKASDEIGKLDVFEFEHIVLRIAQAEGVDEQEMLLRLFAIFQKEELRKLTATNTKLSGLFQRLRLVSAIPAEMPMARLQTWKLQQREIYETGDQINRHHLPIEVGDVFAKADGQSGKSYILLGQPCDLMVRSKGERAPKVREVILGEVGRIDAKPTSYDQLLPYFGDAPAEKYYVRFKRIYTVPIEVLDLCVFNSDGISRLVAQCPKEVHPIWQTRHSLLKKALDGLLDDYDKVVTTVEPESERPTITKELIKKFPPVVGREALFKPNLVKQNGERQLTFNCVRTRRLDRARSIALALSYASHFSRPAFNRDLGEPISASEHEATAADLNATPAPGPQAGIATEGNS